MGRKVVPHDSKSDLPLIVMHKQKISTDNPFRQFGHKSTKVAMQLGLRFTHSKFSCLFTCTQTAHLRGCLASNFFEVIKFALDESI